MSKLMNIVALLTLGGLVGVVGWWTNHYRESIEQHERDIEAREERILALKGALAAQARALRAAQERLSVLSEENEELELRNRLLRLDHRLARVEVLAQREAEGSVTTSVRFTELGPGGKPMGEAKELEVKGRFLYLESQVVKFSDEYIESADPLRGTSICLFRRVFGEQQRPMDGPELDPVGASPGIITGDNVRLVEHSELWKRFWDYANDPELASAAGVRAVHGEAPFTELRPGKSYRVELRASGGLSIQPE